MRHNNLFQNWINKRQCEYNFTLPLKCDLNRFTSCLPLTHHDQPFFKTNRLTRFHWSNMNTLPLLLNLTFPHNISSDDSVFTKTHKHHLFQSLYTTRPITFYECNLQYSSRHTLKPDNQQENRWSQSEHTYHIHTPNYPPPRQIFGHHLWFWNE